MRQFRRTRGWWCAVSLRSNQRHLYVRPGCSGDGSRDGVVTDCRRSTPDLMMRCSTSARTSRRVCTLFVYRLADVIAAGFEVVPTYRSPHVTITFYDDVDSGVARLLAVSHRIVSNPAFRQKDA